MGKKIYITGIAGFLGSHLADELIAQGHEVIGCDNLIGGYVDNVPDEAEFYQTDCLDLSKQKRLLEGVDIVYHCACTPHEGLSVFSPALITLNTFQSTATMASASIQAGVKRFVNCSSMARYGTQKTVPFTEDMEPLPQDPYGVAKVAAENLLFLLSKVHGIEVVNLVPHNIIGPRQKFDDPYRNVASIMINRMLQGKQPIIYGDGNQKRCFSFVDDDVGCLVKAGFQKDVVGQTINIGPDEEFITINELSVILGELMDIKVKPIYVADRPQEVRLAYCSANKARKMFGYKTTISLRDGLSSMIGYIKKKGPRKFRYHLDLEIISEKTPKTWTQRMF